ncbi:MAG: isoprenylcysteine carboxylmethyltransferase family protein [Atopobiaceae bacterium]|nr:isoprenylcysteine carboxylmethyltransferase family protein [Atopobiaceae bacterium]
MDTALAKEAFAKVAAGFVLMALLLFLPAGTIRWWNGWLLMGCLFVPMVGAGIVMLFKAPELVRRRLNARESEDDQQLVVKLSGLMFVAAFVLAGLGYRFGWAQFPRVVCIIAAVAFVAGYALFAEVLRENEYLSRTIEVSQGQHVIDTGLYGVVRHPMYAATLIMFMAMPVMLGSPFSLVVMLAYLPIINARMEGEERVLAKELEGYTDYLKRVRWRVIPHLW